MQGALERARGFVIVYLKEGTPNIVWLNCKPVFLFSIKNSPIDPEFLGMKKKNDPP